MSDLAVDGRIPGHRGRATRRRLLDCTRDMLSVETYRDLRVVDIAREAGTSPATFYQYFPDVTAAILALCEDLADDGRERLTSLVETGSWRGAAGFDASSAIAAGFLDFWDQHWPLMRVMELTSAEGDQRFRASRTALLNEFTTRLSETITVVQKDQPVADPMATASVLVSMLAHVAAHRSGFACYGVEADSLQRAMASIVFSAVTGRAPRPS